MAGSAAAADGGTESFYSGRVITYLVGSKPGGGYDAYARLIARHMQEHLPGARIRVHNVPGAGSIVAANQLSIAKADGLTIGTFNSGLFYAQLQGSDGLQIDLRDFSWIGKAAVNERVMVVSTNARFQSIETMQASAEPLLFGASAIGSAARNEALILRHLLGIKIRIVTGLSGNDSQMSMMRGEIDGAFGSFSSFTPFLERGDGKVLLTIGRGQDVDSLLDAVAPGVDTAVAHSLLNLIDSVAALGRLTVAPPNLPADRLSILREAYDRTLHDREFLEDARRIGLPVEPLSGADVLTRAAAILNQPAEMRELISEITRFGDSR